MKTLMECQLIFVNLLSCWFLWKNPRLKSLSTEVFVVGCETKNKDKQNKNELKMDNEHTLFMTLRKKNIS